MRYVKFLVLVVFFAGCNYPGDGALGAFQQWSFRISEKRLDEEIATLYRNNPKYIIPEKWKMFDTWNESGYGHLRGKIIYFKDDPEEMYYTSCFEVEANSFGNDGDSTITTIAVRAINSGDKLIINKKDTVWYADRWNKRDNCDERKVKNVDERFYNEIISKLENQIGQKARKEDAQ